MIDEAAAQAQGVLDPDTYAHGDPATYGLPLDLYDHLRDTNPVLVQEFPDDPLMRDRLYVLTRYEDVKQADGDSATWSSASVTTVFNFTPLGYEPWQKPAMIAMDGDDHRRNRAVVSRKLRPSLLHALESRFRVLARRLVERALESGTSFNFVTEIAHVMPMEALGEVLGVPEADRPQFFRWVDVFSSPLDPRTSGSLEAVLEAFNDLFAYSLALVKQRQSEPANDLTTALAEALSDGRMSEAEVMGNMFNLASGAAESTRSALSHGLHQLMREPDQMGWLRDRSEDIPTTAVNEILRIAAPFTHLCRQAMRDVEIHGKQIGAGEVICLLWAAANFDSRAFDDPRRFDLARDPNAHLTFGWGPHACIGKHIAMLEIKVLLEELLRGTRAIVPAGEISYVRDIFARGVYDLPVTLVPA